MTVKPLPANPNITQIKKQAKDLQRGAQSRDDAAIARVVESHPSIESADQIADDFALRDAQITVAREYGFESWHKLNAEVGERMVEERDLHRWFGVQLNNGMWDKIEDESFGPDSPLLDRELALYSAYASAYHWRHAGNEANVARGEHLVSRMATKVGELNSALHHARRALDVIAHHRDVMADWDEPFAHEAMARALAGLGRTDEAREHRELAEQQTAALDDEGDRAVLEGELAREPWFGLTTG